MLDKENDGATTEFARINSRQPALRCKGTSLSATSQSETHIDTKISRPSSKQNPVFSLSPVVVQLPEIDGHPVRIDRYDSKPAAISALCDQGTGTISNFCTYDATNRIIRTYKYGFGHPDEILSQKGLETKWLPIALDHDEVEGQKGPSESRSRDETASANNWDHLIRSPRDAKKLFPPQCSLTQRRLKELNSDACSSQRNFRYDFETEFLNQDRILPASGTGNDLLAPVLATIRRSDPDNECKSHASTNLESLGSTPSSDHGRAILKDDAFFLEVDPGVASSYGGSQNSKSSRTSLLDIECLLEDETLEADVRRELEDLYNVPELESVAPKLTWIDLGRCYRLMNWSTGLGQSTSGELPKEENLSDGNFSVCCSSDELSVENLENGEVANVAACDDLLREIPRTRYGYSALSAQTTKSLERVLHKRHSSDNLPSFEHIENTATMSQASLAGSPQVMTRTGSIADAVPDKLTATPLQTLYRTQSKYTHLYDTKSPCGYDAENLNNDEHSWSMFADTSETMKARRRQAVACPIPHSAMTSVKTESLLMTPPCLTEAYGRRSNRRSGVPQNITRDGKWPAYATFRRSHRRREYQSRIRKVFVDNNNYAHKVDEKRSLSTESLPSGFHFSSFGDNLVERENVVDVSPDHLTDSTIKCKDEVEQLEEPATRLVTKRDKLPNIVAHIEPIEVFEGPGMRLKPVAAADLNIKIVGKAARNSQLAKQEKRIRVGALIDILQSYGLMSEMMAPKFRMPLTAFAHQSSAGCWCLRFDR